MGQADCAPGMSYDAREELCHNTAGAPPCSYAAAWGFAPVFPMLSTNVRTGGTNDHRQQSDEQRGDNAATTLVRGMAAGFSFRGVSLWLSGTTDK